MRVRAAIVTATVSVAQLVAAVTRYDAAGQPCPEGKFFGNFPYPYMNGMLHLGHAFSLSKVSCHGLLLKHELQRPGNQSGPAASS